MIFALSALALCALLAGCAESSGTGGVSVAKMNSDSTAVDSALTVYEDLSNQNPSTPGDLTTFMSVGSVDLETLRTSFNTWSYDVDHVNPTGNANKAALPLMKSYRDALNAWLSGEETQAEGSRACLGAGPISQSTLDCYQRLTMEAAPAAQAALSRLTDAQQLLRALLGR